MLTPSSLDSSQSSRSLRSWLGESDTERDICTNTGLILVRLFQLGRQIDVALSSVETDTCLVESPHSLDLSWLKWNRPGYFFVSHVHKPKNISMISHACDVLFQIASASGSNCLDYFGPSREPGCLNLIQRLPDRIILQVWQHKVWYKLLNQK